MRPFNKPGSSVQQEVQQTIFEKPIVEEAIIEEPEKEKVVTPYEPTEMSVNIYDEKSIIILTASVLQKAKLMVVNNQQDAENATAFGLWLTENLNNNEKARLFHFKGVKAEMKRVEVVYNSVRDPFKAAMEIIRPKIALFQAQEKRRLEADAAQKRKEEEDKIQSEAELAEDVAPESGLADKILESAPTKAPKVESASVKLQGGGQSVYKEKWIYKVTDIKALANARPDLVMENVVLVNGEIKKEVREIPGLEIYQEGNTSFRK